MKIIIDIIEGKRRRFDFFLRPVLLFFSFFFALAVKTRNFLFNQGFLKIRKCAAPVISIGNIVAGGTGKTPFTYIIAKELSRHYKVGILARGYHGKLKKKEVKLISSEKGMTSNPEECGDEPFLLAKKLPEAIIVVGRDRYKGAKLAIAHGAEVLLLDDGFQHRKLYRDIDVLVTDFRNPFGNGFFLPRGMLRDDKKRLSEANFICSPTKASDEFLNNLKIPKSAVIDFEVVIEEIYLADGSQKWNYKEFLDSSIEIIGFFCGIAQPQRFFDTVVLLKKRIANSLLLADHQMIEMEQLSHFVLMSKKKGAQMVLCTEKDFVKISHFPFSSLALPLGVLKVNLKVLCQKKWQHFLNQIKSKVENRQ